MVNYASSLDRVYQYLLIAAFFLLPLTVSGNNIAIWLVVILWLCSGGYSNKLKSILDNKLALASILFFLAHIIGLIWTEDTVWGLEITRKMIPFLFVLPIFLTLTRKDNNKLYIAAFFIAMLISVSLSYLIWFELIDPFKYANSSNPTPLMSHVSYNPFLAFSIYLILNEILNCNKADKLKIVIYSFLLILMIINMFITGGRAGQVMFFAAIVIAMFQYFRLSKLKAVISSFLIVAILSYVAYSTSPLFKERVVGVYNEISNFEENTNTSLGLRINYFINSSELIIKNPIFGVGTGDFPKEYYKLNLKKSPEFYPTVQPHNMYLLVLSQLGVFGLLCFLSLFFIQFKIALISNNKFVNQVGVAMPLLFLIIMWSDSYLLGHYTSNLYILFSAYIYGNSVNEY